MELLTNGWAYLTLFGTLYFTGIGLPPVPEELPVIAAGVASNSKELLWWLAAPVCVLGVVSADATLYGLGWFGGQSLFRWRWVKRLLPTNRRQELEDGFRRRAVIILLLGRLLPGTRTGVFLTAGSVRYPAVRFLMIDGLTAVVSVGCVFFGSYLLMESFTLLVDGVNQVGSMILVCVCMFLGWYLLSRYSRRITS